jgi:PGF-CTERM protein
VNGEPLDPDANYTVTVNSYMAGWNGSPLANATRTNVDWTMYGEVFYNYIESEGTVTPTDADRIRRVDFEADAGTVELDGEGSVEVTFQKPTADNRTVVNTQSFYALNSRNERVNATSASISDGQVTVTFDDGELRSLAEGGDVEVYGNYLVDRPSRPYFDNSVVNADLSADLVDSTTTTTTGDETTADETTETTTGETVTADDETGGTTPGFGVATALVAMLAGALLVTRRD